MSQDIDLLAATSADRQHWPSGTHAAIFLVATLILTVGSGRWLNGRVEAVEQQIAATNAAIDDLVFSLQERSQFLVDRNADPRLLEELDQRERELADKSQVLHLLSGETLGNTGGFAAHLAALGRRHPDGLWLQRIRLGDGGRELELRGQASHARLLPQFLDGLKAETAFSGIAFETVVVSAGTALDYVDFVLATGCTEADSEDAAGTCLSSPPTFSTENRDLAAPRTSDIGGAVE